MTVFEVGKRYNANRTNWPEAAQFVYQKDELHLHLFLPAMPDAEIAAYRAGAASFALVVDGPVVFLLYKFGTASWSDAPYTWHLVPEDQRSLPDPAPLPEGQGRLLTIVVTSAEDGIIQVLRGIGLGTAFSNALLAAIRAQATTPFDPAAYDIHLNRLYARYPHSALMLSLATARWPEPGTAGKVGRGKVR